MTAFDLDPQIRWAFCFSHPDDEIAICAWIKRLTANGNLVYLSWTHSNAVREAESRKVARCLEVIDQNLTFFQAPDGEVCHQMTQLIPEFSRWLDETKPDRVVCCAFEQGHLDHDATNFIVHQTFEGPILEIPMYFSYAGPIQTLNRFSDPTGQEILELEEPEQRLKKDVAKSYPSQRLWRNVFWHEVFEVLQFRKPSLAKTERMRFARHSSFTQPNHPPRLARTISSCKKWFRWLSALKRCQQSQIEA